MGATARVRMTPEDRRRQLVGIGLRKFVERPVQELSLDEVAAEAGRLARAALPLLPDQDRLPPGRRRGGRGGGSAATSRRMPGWSARPRCARSSSGSSTRWPGGGRRTSRSCWARRRSPGRPATTRSRRCASTWPGWWPRAADLPDAALPAVHGWVAYLEDRALQWAALPAAERDAGRLALVDHCTRALALLTAQPRRPVDFAK